MHIFNWLFLYYYSIIIFFRHFCFLGPRSPFWGETLASSTRGVYPPRFLRRAALRCGSVFL
jgi:hypothetical protein